MRTPHQLSLESLRPSSWQRWRGLQWTPGYWGVDGKGKEAKETWIKNPSVHDSLPGITVLSACTLGHKHADGPGAPSMHHSLVLAHDAKLADTAAIVSISSMFWLGLVRYGMQDGLQLRKGG